MVKKKLTEAQVLSQRGRNSRQKGGSGEREVVRLFTDLGFEANRRPQYRGIVKDGPDVLCVHPTGFSIGVESKLQQKISVHEVIRQAISSVSGSVFPLGYIRRNREKGIIVMPVSVFSDLMARLLPPPIKCGWGKKPVSRACRERAALKAARPHVHRQQFKASHEQDRIDAKDWLNRYGDL